MFEYINGFHDTANSIATVVSTKVLTPRQAVIMAAIFNLFGALAGTAVARLRPDLVLMDLKMPRLNGLQATRKIRAEFPGVRVIMITLHDSKEVRAASIAAGADGFIPKRCFRDELPGAIAQLFPDRADGAEEERP